MKFLIFTALIVLVGCATASHVERDELSASPIDCAKADTDLQALKAALPSGEERAHSILQTAPPSR